MVYILLRNDIVMGYKHCNIIILWYNYVIQIYATAT